MGDVRYIRRSVGPDSRRYLDPEPARSGIQVRYEMLVVVATTLLLWVAIIFAVRAAISVLS